MRSSSGRRHPPAWYPDPEHPGRIRRWDGRSWTDDVRPVPTWLRTLRLSPGPTARVPTASRRLWITSAACLLLGALFLLVLGRSGSPDPDRIGDRRFASAADDRCAAVAADEREELIGEWGRMVDDLRALPVADADTAAVDRWLRSWDRSIALTAERAEALAEGDEQEAGRLLDEREAHDATRIRFALVNGMNRCLFR